MSNLLKRHVQNTNNSIHKMHFQETPKTDNRRILTESKIKSSNVIGHKKKQKLYLKQTEIDNNYSTQVENYLNFQDKENININLISSPTCRKPRRLCTENAIYNKKLITTSMGFHNKQKLSIQDYGNSLSSNKNVVELLTANIRNHKSHKEILKSLDSNVIAKLKSMSRVKEKQIVTSNENEIDNCSETKCNLSSALSNELIDSSNYRQMNNKQHKATIQIKTLNNKLKKSVECSRGQTKTNSTRESISHLQLSLKNKSINNECSRDNNEFNSIHTNCSVNNNELENVNFESIEEVHFALVKIIQKGKECLFRGDS